jgi:DNA-directed RNA polymerase beta' subunit
MNTEIKAIQFGILNDKDILDMSVCEINKTTLNPEPGSIYDPRLGVCESESGLCVTCGKNVWSCVGHFGHISLAIPIIIFYKPTVSMLKIFCFKCSRLLLSKEEIEVLGLKGYDKISSYISENINFCTRKNCSWTQPKIKYDSKDNTIVTVFKNKTNTETFAMQPEKIKMIFDKVVDEDITLIGIDVNMFHPKNLVLTIFPVIPTNCRPRMITPDITSDDDLSITLVDIIKNNQILQKNTDNEKARAVIKFKIQTFCDNSRGTAIHTTNHRPITGLKERITKKTGHVRQNMMGKRCDRTARTVVGGDSTLRLNEVGVPYEIANIITIPVFVNHTNIEEMTKMVNTPGKVCVIIKKNGTRLSVARASVKPGTVLNHGDKITRNGDTFVVTNCKIELKEGDIIRRKLPNGQEEKTIPTVLPERRHIAIDIGDKLERYMQNGDYLLLNRQPTLHRNSMQGMKVVLLPGKTFRVNLAITAGFNVDFDGDEFNAFIGQHLESKAELKYISNAKYNILSAQSNKPEMVIVQDSLLGAYVMTKQVFRLSKKDFQQCIMRIDHIYDYTERFEQIKFLRKESEYTAHALFGFLFPPDFHYKTQQLEIRYGVVVSGFFDKQSLKGTKKSIIRVLCMEYNEKITARFIDNLQFITNAFLEIFPFSIGIHDCLIGAKIKRDEIKNTAQQFFLEASKVETTTDIGYIRENRINVALNKAKDIGLRIAKEALAPNNNFINTVVSGSKGDFFNIAQITGLLGQQNINNQRPRFCLSNNTRTLVHYPECITSEELKYRSRGFVASSFIEGMHPDEMFFHAMTGREGMTKTAMGTAASGYLQRSIVKINEDLKVEYDGTVRDAKKNIYQYFYGGHGFDVSKVDIEEETNEVFPVNFERLADRLNKGFFGDQSDQPLVFLEEEEIEEIIEKCKFQTSQTLQYSADRVNIKQADLLRRHLSRVKIRQDKIQEFTRHIIKKYNTCKATPGDAVGVLCAQSIGERQTQTTLDTFHTAGKLVFNSVNRLEEILNMNKKLKIKSCTIHFRQKYQSAEELRQAIKSSLVAIYFQNIYTHFIFEADNEIVFFLNIQTLFSNRINPVLICTQLKNLASDIVENAFFTLTTITVVLKPNPDPQCSFVNLIKTELNNVLLCGIPGIKRYHLQYDNEWYVITEGTNLKKLLIHPLVDPRRVYSNDLWEIYNVLGIVGFRRFILAEFRKVIGGVNYEHSLLLTDKMTSKGKPLSITRYTMRTNDVGPISKATFEESIDILIHAAIHTEKEKMQGVSASIIVGNRAPIGTGFFDLCVDVNKLTKRPQDSIDQSIQPDEDEYSPEEWLES